jgi:hypothetical protein
MRLRGLLHEGLERAPQLPSQPYPAKPARTLDRAGPLCVALRSRLLRTAPAGWSAPVICCASSRAFARPSASSFPQLRDGFLHHLCRRLAPSPPAANRCDSARSCAEPSAADTTASASSTALSHITASPAALRKHQKSALHRVFLPAEATRPATATLVTQQFFSRL